MREPSHVTRMVQVKPHIDKNPNRRFLPVSCSSIGGLNQAFNVPQGQTSFPGELEQQHHARPWPWLHAPQRRVPSPLIGAHDCSS